MDKKTLIIVLLSLILIGLVIWDRFFRERPSPIVINYDYITDTIIDSIPYQVPIPYPVPTPPSTIVIHISDSLAIDSLSLIIKGKEILIARLRDTLAIQQNFLKQYPNNPKLLSMNLTRDSLVFGLLPITAQIEEYHWPIDLNRFNYSWSLPLGLHRQSTSLPPTEKKPFAKYFVGGGVNFVSSSLYLSGKMEKDWSRIRLYGETQIGLLKKETSAIRIGVDYRIYGKNRD